METMFQAKGSYTMATPVLAKLHTQTTNKHTHTHAQNAVPLDWGSCFSQS